MPEQDNRREEMLGMTPGQLYEWAEKRRARLTSLGLTRTLSVPESVALRDARDIANRAYSLRSAITHLCIKRLVIEGEEV